MCIAHVFLGLSTGVAGLSWGLNGITAYPVISLLLGMLITQHSSSSLL